VSDALVVIQALVTLASLGIAAFLARLTVKRDREVKAERERDRRHEQRRRLVDALDGFSRVLNNLQATDKEFNIARAQVAAALALAPAALPACEALLADDLQPPRTGSGTPSRGHVSTRR
jgi:hypothetical protein